MASIYGASQLARGFDSLSPATPLRTQFAVLSRFPNVVSTIFWGDYVKLCKTISRNSQPINMRAMCSASFGQGTEDAVKKTVGGNPVVVYSKPWCSPSRTRTTKGFGKANWTVNCSQCIYRGQTYWWLYRVITEIAGTSKSYGVISSVNANNDTVKLHQEGKLKPLLAEAGAKKSE
ncbi:monothiol glutaredoxin-S10-like isoform X2 [Primulina tabacum]|uniref:monothiol glutaredoxin-S10-like isoform X2 n=1 Tax=Primulina tabacum TaxID=48773 RepID=UPI003F5A78BE